MIYRFFDGDRCVMETEYPIFEDYDEKVQSFYVVDEAHARAILVRPEGDHQFESYDANIQGREGFPWLEKTLRMEVSQS